MSKLIRKTKSKLAKMERGQVLVLVALAIVGIVAIIGLALDVGVMFMENARLRRAVDAAALAAALQYRQGITSSSQLEPIATEFLLVNGVTLNTDHPVIVKTCTDTPSMCDDATLGKNIPRKLVYVYVTATVHLAFLPVIGINEVNISAKATGESASLDLVLVLDTSESMTSDAKKPGDSGYDPQVPWDLRDPTVCNDDAKVEALGLGIPVNDGMPGECHPFEEVKTAAVNFVNSLFFPYDRVAVVSFNKTATTLLRFDQNCLTPPCTTQEIRDTITGVIKDLEVYDADKNVCPTGQPCLSYCTQAIIDAYYCNLYPENWIDPAVDNRAVYSGQFDCGDTYVLFDDLGNPGDPSQCSSTNIGGGLWEAGNAFTVDPKQASLWVVVLLTDGAANSGTFTDNSPTCPENTWNRYRESPGPEAPMCRDTSSETRHCADLAQFDTCQKNGNGLPAPLFQFGQWDPLSYDADDFAHDMADWVGITQNAVIFAVGLGPQVHTSDDAGGKLLTYAAEKVGNGLYQDGGATDLAKIFKTIGDKIATRLAH